MVSLKNPNKKYGDNMENNELMKDVIKMMTDKDIEKSLFDSGRTYGYNYERNINLEDQYIILHDIT